jgi:hypothetical protein
MCQFCIKNFNLAKGELPNLSTISCDCKCSDAKDRLGHNASIDTGFPEKILGNSTPCAVCGHQVMWTTQARGH